MTTPAAAAPGDFDRSFSHNGKVMRTLGPSDVDYGLQEVAIQDDGRIVVAGTARFRHGWGGYGFVVARFLRNGSLDRGFSRNGSVRTFVPSPNYWVKDVHVLPNGKIVVIGLTGSSDRYGEQSASVAIARFRRDGRLDRSFSGDGKLTRSLEDRSLWANAGVIQDDGKIVVVGGSAPDEECCIHDGFLARFNRDGSWDRSFGEQGTTIATGVVFKDVAVQPDGAVVAVGGTSLIGSDFAAARYDAGGSPDPSFSGDGIVWTDFAGQTDDAEAVELTPDGDLVVGGFANGSDGDFGLARYSPDGALDTSFSGDGLQTTAFGPERDAVNDLVLQPDGRLVAVGFATVRSRGNRFRPDMAVARYRANGAPDGRFRRNGRRTVDMRGWDFANGVTLDKRGRIVIAGEADASFNRPHGKARAAVVRLRG